MQRLLLLPLVAGLLFLTPKLYAQTPPSTVADSLMEHWVEIWNAEDSEALRELFAEDVVMMDDALGTTGEGRDALMPGYEARMAETHGLQVQPLYSYEEEDYAYQVGRWVLYAPDGWLTGTHTFIFERAPDGQWKLQSTYYTHDPVARLEEFPSAQR